MSDDSDCGPKTKRKRPPHALYSSQSSTSSSSSIICTARRRRLRRCEIEDSSDSDSGSSIELKPKRRALPRVPSDPDSDSSGSVIIRQKRLPKGAVINESSDESDHGFEGSSSSQWETDVSDTETPNTSKIKKPETAIDSDSSDGQSEKCPICLISFVNQEVGSPETCEHLFCVECIQEWSKNMNTCPVDRKEYNTILVRKNINDSIYKSILVQPPNPANEVDGIVEDLTFCEVCGQSDREDRMLLCDGCDLGYHLECLEPPLEDIPPGAWFCNDCSPEDAADVRDVDLLELQLLLDEAGIWGHATTTSRRNTSRLIPRTRQSERVRRRIVNNRQAAPQPVTSSNTRRKRKTRRKPRYKIIYKVDETTGETITVKKRMKRRRTKKRKLKPAPKTAKTRLATQLGICAPRNVPQSLPDMRVPPPMANLHSQRYQAGIPALRLFGDPDALDWFSGEEDGDGVVMRRGVGRRRRLVKEVAPVSSSTDVLGSILEVQTRFHSKRTRFSVGKDGSVSMESGGSVLGELNDFGSYVRQTPSSYTDEGRGDSLPSSSGQGSSSSERNATAPTSSTVESHPSEENVSNAYSNEAQDYTQGNLNTVYTSDENKKEKETNETPRSQTPASESEVDIYSDIETVSTSKVEECELKASSPISATPNGGSEDDNDSELDMVIDTEKTTQEPEENTKEETAVSSTVDSNIEATPALPTVSSTSEIQSQAVQSTNEVFEKENDKDDEDSEDGCPNFSIYSKESITMAKNTDITLGNESNQQETNQVGEVSSSPAEATTLKHSSGLYSDSEDETIVKKGIQNSFGITDIRNMTEDISEEERSYTPCLDERPDQREGIEGLDTEMISDEDRNDFDESQELKTASDGDALEINAKESELDFTRPEDYEEGEIVDKLKNKKSEEAKEPAAKKSAKPEEETRKKDTESSSSSNKESAFKKLSKNNKERNYRDKDRERSKSREDNRKDKKKEKRREIERYDVRAIIADKPRRVKDQFGRDIRRRSDSRSITRTPSLPRRSPSNPRRSTSRTRRSTSRKRSLSKGRKKRKRSRNRSKSRSPRRSRSKTKKRKRSSSRERRKKSRDRSKGKSKKQRSRSRQRSRSPTPKRTRDWSRRRSREWTPSFSRSRSPETRHFTPSWTPPRVMDDPVKPHNLTVILSNNSGKKKKEKKKKSEKKAKENEKAKKKKRNEKTPPPSKEVFASGDNILVSVSFNKDNETRDVSTKKKQREVEEPVKTIPPKKDKKKKKKDLSGVKPIAIIDLERSPFKELTPSPKDIIVLSDSDNEEARNVQKSVCDSSQQVESPNYATGPKTPPEPQVKFTLTKQTQLRPINNPLHDPDDIEPEGDTQEEVDVHKGPNTPPEPPNSPPSSPDAYDPFEPTKSRSPTPELLQTSQPNTQSEKREDSSMEELEKPTSCIQQPDSLKSLTPPLADVQPADSQSSLQIQTPESSLSKSPERSTSNVSFQAPIVSVSKPVAQTIPFSSSVPPLLMTSTSTTLAQPRVNILNSTMITPPNVVSSVQQRIVLPSPVKISPTKAQVKSTPVNKPMPSKAQKKSSNRNQNGSDTIETTLGLDSPYSPGSSDYEDLFEPPSDTTPKPVVVAKPPKPSKSPSKVQNTFDALFGSPFNKVKAKPDKPAAKTNKKGAPTTPSKGTKQIGVKLDEDNLKILDELPNSAVEMQVKDKFLKKLNRQERVVEEVKLVLKPHYNKKHISKEEYKDILRRAVPKICHNKSGEINPTKIKNLIEAYVKKVRHSKKVTSSSNTVNPQKA